MSWPPEPTGTRELVLAEPETKVDVVTTDRGPDSGAARRPSVEPTDNHAERELRAFVLWRKRSFGTQSERGNRFAERLMTVAHTARKQGKNPTPERIRPFMARREPIVRTNARVLDRGGKGMPAPVAKAG